MFHQPSAIILAFTILLWTPNALSFIYSSSNLSTRGIRRPRIHSIYEDDCRRDAQSTQCHQTTDMHATNSSESWGSSPYLAILTEPDACASVERVEETIRAIGQATADGGVDLVMVRVAADDGPGIESALLKWALLKNLAEMKRQRGFILVVNDDVEIVLKALSQNMTVDGVHVKEHKAGFIPSIRSKLEHAVTCSFKDNSNSIPIIIGTSCHSLESAKRSYQLSPRGPDYLFVGTCYLTQSHPEKQSADQLEGPSLPGRVKQELYQIYDSKDGTSTSPQSNSISSRPPIIFAIGGIDEQNCHEPVARFGADGVATIRTVMQSSNPKGTVEQMKNTMQSRKDSIDNM